MSSWSKLAALLLLLTSLVLGACEGAQPEEAQSAAPIEGEPAAAAEPEPERESETESAAEPEPEPELPPAPLTHYMGREIATTMHWTGAEWLLRQTREREEGTSRLLEALAPQPGDVFCDFGSGNGYLTLPLAELVGPTGRVWASEIQPEMLRMLKERAVRKELQNLSYVIGSAMNPRLPRSTFDTVLMVDVYHEISYPEQVLAGVRESLKPGGRLVLVEFRAEDPDVPIKRLHKMSKEQVRKELEANGYRLTWEYDELPWQHVLGFEAAQ